MNINKANKSLEKICSLYSKNIASIAHVGAHLGQEVEIYKKYTEDFIYLFEPQKEVFKKLKENTINLNNVELFNFALGSENKMVELNKSSTNDGASSSILQPGLHKTLHEEIKFLEKEKVKLKRFDSLDIEGVNFLTIDVQGFELEVLNGFGEMISKLDFIYTEINRDYVYKENVLIEDLDYKLEKEGFIRLKTFWDGYLPYGDAFYIKKEFLSKRGVIYSKIKTKFLDSKINIFIVRIKNYEKTVFNIKKLIKNLIK